MQETVSTAGVEYFDSERLQLTPEAIRNIGRKDAHLFHFGDTTDPSTVSKSRCKALPGDESWPAEDTWRKLNRLLGGSLIKAVPLAAPCYDSWPEQRNASECKRLTDAWADPRTQYVIKT